MCESDAAGSSPRSRSSAFACTARACAAASRLPAPGRSPRPTRSRAAARARRSRRPRPSRARTRRRALVAVVAVAAAGHRRVVGDVARRLLEVGAHPRPLEDLREDVRDPLAGDVRAAELRDRVVAVADEDPLVELGGAAPSSPSQAAPGSGQRVGELVEEQPAQRALVARVAREQRALDRLRQPDEPEDRLVEVREVRGEARSLRPR